MQRRLLAFYWFLLTGHSYQQHEFFVVLPAARFRFPASRTRVRLRCGFRPAAGLISGRCTMAAIVRDRIAWLKLAQRLAVRANALSVIAQMCSGSVGLPSERVWLWSTLRTLCAAHPWRV